MNKNLVRQSINLLLVIATIVVNALANIIPFNGKNTGVISGQFHVYFVPAGYVFSIWGIIYLGLIAYGIYQALPAQRDNPRLRNADGFFILASLANILWLFLWHYEQFVGTLAAMLVLLASLIAVYLRLRIHETKVSKSETWAVRIPFSIYLGWITVATIANVTDVLDYVKWNQFGHSAGTWMLFILFAVVVIAGLMSFTRRDIAYTAIILWALAGIGVKFPHQGIITTGIWIAFGLVAATLAGAFLVKRKTA